MTGKDVDAREFRPNRISLDSHIRGNDGSFFHYGTASGERELAPINLEMIENCLILSSRIRKFQCLHPDFLDYAEAV